MKNEILKYSSLKIIKAGICCSIAICGLILLIAFIGFYYVPGSTLLNADMLIWRMSGGIVTCFLSVVLVFNTKKYLQKLFPVWILISFLGSVILISFIPIYLFIVKFIGNKNCEKTGMSECYLLSFEQTILSVVLAFIFSFVVSGLLFFITHYLYKSFSKRINLK